MIPQCKHKNIKTKLVAEAIEWSGGRSQRFVMRLCCADCGKVLDKFTYRVNNTKGAGQ